MRSNATDTSMREIPLTQGAVATVDDEDYGLVSLFKWCLSRAGYASRSIGRTESRVTVLMHRFIMRPGRGQEIDHINGDRLDNRRANLRLCTHAQNTANSRGRSVRRNHQSRFKGVVRNGHRQSWRAEITASGRRFYLGSFATELEAAQAYDAAAINLHGEFARLNFPAMQSVTQPLL